MTIIEIANDQMLRAISGKFSFQFFSTKTYSALSPLQTANGLTTPLTYSVVSGPTTPHLSSKTLPRYFTKDILLHHASRPALVCRQEAVQGHAGPLARNFKDVPYIAWDYVEFDRHIRALAKGLLGMGVKRGDRVGVIMGNNR